VEKKSVKSDSCADGETFVTFLLFFHHSSRELREKMETRRITRPRVISIPLFERNGGKKETTTRRRKRQQRAKGKRRTWTDDIFFNLKSFY
jgi:hypothetical protein